MSPPVVVHFNPYPLRSFLEKMVSHQERVLLASSQSLEMRANAVKMFIWPDWSLALHHICVQKKIVYHHPSWQRRRKAWKAKIAKESSEAFMRTEVSKTALQASSSRTPPRRYMIKTSVAIQGRRRTRPPATQRHHRRRIRRLVLLLHAGIPRLLHDAVQRDYFAAGVDCDDAPAFDALDAFAEEPGLHESVADEV
jgi:hypothetical protein